MADKTQELLATLRGDKPSISWGEAAMQGVTNIPASGLEFAKNTIYPFMHPIETAKSFKDIGAGILSKTGAINDPDAEAKIEAIGQFFADRYGSIENLKNTLANDPVGLAADISVVLTAGGALAAKAPGMVGTVGRVAGATGRAIDPLIAAGKGARLAGKAVSIPLGTTTGAGSRAIRGAATAGETGNRAFLRHLRGGGDITEPVAMAKRGVSNLVRERGAAYEAGMTGVKASRQVLDMKPVWNAVLKASRKTRPYGVAKSEDATKVLGKIYAKLRQYDGLKKTPGVVDDMKQAIGEIRQKTDFGSLERNIADDVYNAIGDTIKKQMPEYADVMKGYGEASDTIREISKGLSTGEKATKETALRKLTSALRNNVNTNYGQRAKMVDLLAKTEPDLLPAIAGQSLSDWAPRGIQRTASGVGWAGGIGAGAAGLLDPLSASAILAGQAAASPRLVGEGAYTAGVASRMAPKTLPTLRGSMQAGRITQQNEPTAEELLNILRGQ